MSGSPVSDVEPVVPVVPVDSVPVDVVDWGVEASPELDVAVMDLDMLELSCFTNRAYAEARSAAKRGRHLGAGSSSSPGRPAPSATRTSSVGH